jgi:hypothetical protein
MVSVLELERDDDRFPTEHKQAFLKCIKVGKKGKAIPETGREGP